eukprot:TRINITY_DN1718_c1_g1_i1.p1 TRINITY_DN1718_c1_g1~~TRINITY_DN1718_c1_g1_i1.p1  ORF type:complete len:1149 (-),score=310.36 TRINITY_DN1718_c1_g1_i1:277-3723(-)
MPEKFLKSRRASMAPAHVSIVDPKDDISLEAAEAALLSARKIVFRTHVSSSMQTDDHDLADLKALREFFFDIRKQVGDTQDAIGNVKKQFSLEQENSVIDQNQWVRSKLEYLERASAEKLERVYSMYSRLEDETVAARKKLKDEQALREKLVAEKTGEVYVVVKQHEETIEDLKLQLKRLDGNYQLINTELERERINFRQMTRKKDEFEKETKELYRDKDEARQTIRTFTDRTAELEAQVLQFKKDQELSEWRLTELRNEVKGLRAQEAKANSLRLTAQTEARRLSEENAKLQTDLEIQVARPHSQLSTAGTDDGTTPFITQSGADHLDPHDRSAASSRSSHNSTVEDTAAPAIVTGDGSTPSIMVSRPLSPSEPGSATAAEEPKKRKKPRKPRHRSERTQGVDSGPLPFADDPFFSQEPSVAPPTEAAATAPATLGVNTTPVRPLSAVSTRSTTSTISAVSRGAGEATSRQPSAVISASERGVDAAVGDSTELLAKFDEMQQEFEAKERRLKERLSNYQSEIAGLTQLLEHAQTNANQVQQQAKELWAETSELKKKAAQADQFELVAERQLEQLQEASTQLDTVTSRADALEGNNIKLLDLQQQQNSALSQVSEKLLVAEQQLAGPVPDEHVDHVTALNARLQTALQQMTIAQQASELSTQMLQGSRTEVQRLQSQVDRLDNELTKAYADGDAARMSLVKVQAELEMEQSHHGGMSQDLEDARNAVLEMQSKSIRSSMNMEQALLEAQTELSEAKHTAQQLQLTRKEVEAEKTQLRSELASVTAQLEESLASNRKQVEEQTELLSKLEVLEHDIADRDALRKEMFDTLTGKDQGVIALKRSNDDLRKAQSELYTRVMVLSERYRLLRSSARGQQSQFEQMHQALMTVQTGQREFNNRVHTLLQLAHHLVTENQSKAKELQNLDVVQSDNLTTKAQLKDVLRATDVDRRAMQTKNDQLQMEIETMKLKVTERNKVVAQLTQRSRFLHQTVMQLSTQLQSKRSIVPMMPQPLPVIPSGAGNENISPDLIPAAVPSPPLQDLKRSSSAGRPIRDNAALLRRNSLGAEPLSSLAALTAPAVLQPPVGSVAPHSSPMLSARGQLPAIPPPPPVPPPVISLPTNKGLGLVPAPPVVRAPNKAPRRLTLSTYMQ